MDDNKTNPPQGVDPAVQQVILSKIPATPAEVQPKDFRLEQLVKHKEFAIQNKVYSVSRFDILLISISSGGIYIIFETLKFYKGLEKPVVFNKEMLGVTGILFTVAIIINFLSQWTSFRANKNEEIWAVYEIRKKTLDDNYDKALHLKAGDHAEQYNSATGVLNVTSAIVMFAGIILLAIFNFLH